MASIAFDSIVKAYPDGTRKIHDVNIHVDDREFVVLVRPSSCGQSRLELHFFDKKTGAAIR